MMTNNQTLDRDPKTGQCTGCGCISWKAIFAGAFVGLGLSFLLIAFASALGLSAFRVSSDNITSIAIGGFIAMLVGAIIVMFFSGWVAGYLNRGHCLDYRVGALAGFLSWSLGLIITGLLTSHFGQILNINVSPQAAQPAHVASGIYGQMLPDTKSTEKTDRNTTRTSNAENRPVSNATAAEEKAVQDLGKVVFFTFILFFAGALASTIGGYCGMKACRYREDNTGSKNI